MKKVITFNQEQDAFIASNYSSMTTNQIREAYNNKYGVDYSKSVIEKRIRVLGLSKGSSKKVTNEVQELDYNDILHRLGLGESYYQISNAYNCNYNRIERFINNHHITYNMIKDEKDRIYLERFEGTIDMRICKSDINDYYYNTISTILEQEQVPATLIKDYIYEYKNRKFIFDLYCPETNTAYIYNSSERARNDKEYISVQEQCHIASYITRYSKSSSAMNRKGTLRVTQYEGLRIKLYMPNYNSSIKEYQDMDKCISIAKEIKSQMEGKGVRTLIDIDSFAIADKILKVQEAKEDYIEMMEEEFGKEWYKVDKEIRQKRVQEIKELEEAF